MTPSLWMLLGAVLIVQLYLVFLFLRIIANVARFVLLLSVFAIVGSTIPGFLSDGMFLIRTPDILEETLGFRFSYEGWIRSDFAPVYYYVVLLILSVVSLALVPSHDDAIARRARTRELLNAEREHNQSVDREVA